MTRPEYQAVRDSVFPGATWHRNEYGDAGWVDLLDMSQLRICCRVFLQDKLPGLPRGKAGQICLGLYGVQGRTGNSVHLLWDRHSINLNDFEACLEELKQLLLGFAATFLGLAGLANSPSVPRPKKAKSAKILLEVFEEDCPF